MSIRQQPVCSRVPVCRGQGVKVRDRYGVVHKTLDFDVATCKSIDPPVVLVRFPAGLEVVELYALEPVVSVGISHRRPEERRSNLEIEFANYSRDEQLEPDQSDGELAQESGEESSDAQEI